jgi:hypothetical protein
LDSEDGQGRWLLLIRIQESIDTSNNIYIDSEVLVAFGLKDFASLRFDSEGCGIVTERRKKSKAVKQLAIELYF